MPFVVRNVSARYEQHQVKPSGKLIPPSVTVQVTGAGDAPEALELELPIHAAMALVAHLQKALLGRVIPWPDKQGLRVQLAHADWLRDGVVYDETSAKAAAKKRAKRSGKKHKRAT